MDNEERVREEGVGPSKGGTQTGGKLHTSVCIEIRGSQFSKFETRGAPSGWTPRESWSQSNSELLPHFSDNTASPCAGAAAATARAGQALGKKYGTPRFGGEVENSKKIQKRGSQKKGFFRPQQSSLFFIFQMAKVRLPLPLPSPTPLPSPSANTPPPCAFPCRHPAR